MLNWQTFNLFIICVLSPISDWKYTLMLFNIHIKTKRHFKYSYCNKYGIVCKIHYVRICITSLGPGRCSRILKSLISWWRHEMKAFSALLAICVGNSPVTGEFPTQRPVTRSFDVFFDLHLNKRLRKQSWGWRFEMPSRPLWRHCNGSKSYQA